ncbi:MAG: exodeoxyribonuclease VII large subunit [Geminicoccaceae bacterium]
MLTTVSNLAEYTVTELAFALKRTVEDAYGLVRVRGELSGFKRAASGHLYFALKDEKALIDAVSWRGSVPKLAFEPADGLEVICTGRLTTYPGRSKYQLVVERIEPAGVGALMALLEERRRLLTAEGLFDPARKRPLPFLPAVIGVVTSPTGAVIRDILHRVADRFPLRVLVWPVLVQGEGAAAQIAAAIQGFGALPVDGPVPRPDVLIVARGGGSIEDLWAFNEEAVVRAAAASPIPLISAVGHETDTTLIDHAADRRAPTPTAAAEMAVPVRRDLLLQQGDLDGRLHHAMARRVDQLAQRLDGLARGLPRPETLVGMAAQRLDDLGERLRLRSPAELVRLQAERLDSRVARLAELVQDRVRRNTADLAACGGRLVPALIATRLDQLRPRLQREAGAMAQAMAAVVDRAGQALDAPARQLEALSHTRVLERGYAIVRSRASGHVLPRLAAVGTEIELDLVFADGELPVRRADARPRGRSSRATGEQGSLL